MSRGHNLNDPRIHSQSCCLEEIVILVLSTEATSFIDIIELTSYIVVEAIEGYE